MSGTNKGLLPELVKLKLAPSQVLGRMTLENQGDAESHPVWEIRGPGNTFEAISPAGDVLRWNGTLAAGQTLTIDTKLGTCVDSLGVNRYAELDTAPRMWAIPPGTSDVVASFQNTTAASRIAVSYRRRRWLVI